MIFFLYIFSIIGRFIIFHFCMGALRDDFHFSLYYLFVYGAFACIDRNASLNVESDFAVYRGRGNWLVVITLSLTMNAIGNE